MDIYPGRVVKATAGRDKDKYFVVVAVENDNFCYIADGKTRKLDMPKLKKIKHLRVTELSLDVIREKLEKGQKVSNSALRKELSILS